MCLNHKLFNLLKFIISLIMMKVQFVASSGLIWQIFMINKLLRYIHLIYSLFDYVSKEFIYRLLNSISLLSYHAIGAHMYSITPVAWYLVKTHAWNFSLFNQFLLHDSEPTFPPKCYSLVQSFQNKLQYVAMYALLMFPNPL